MTAQTVGNWPLWVQVASLLITCILCLISLSSIGYLWLLLIAASRATSHHKNTSELNVALDSPVPPRVAIVIPAHNEELVLASTLASLKAQDYHRDALEVVVIADNCIDTTAAIAREFGAVVLERTDAVKRGKGYALEWAFDHLLGPRSLLEEAQRGAVTAFLIVDADTYASPDFVSRMVQRLQAIPTTEALQGRYGVLNPEEGWRAALMTAAFDLFNHVKLLGADRLGWGVGLKGNGMAFKRSLLERARWRGNSITEDIDYGLDLLSLHGVRVGYVPEARVMAQMPLTGEQAASQRERWERGRRLLLRERALPLLKNGLRRRDAALCAAALDLIVPPLSEVVGLVVLWGALLLPLSFYHLLPSTMAVAQAVAFATACIALCAYVLIGLRVAGARREAYVALLRAPVYIVWKFILYAARPLKRLTTGRKTATQDAATGEEWVRTARTAMGKDEPPSVQHHIRNHARTDERDAAQL